MHERLKKVNVIVDKANYRRLNVTKCNNNNVTQISKIMKWYFEVEIKNEKIGGIQIACIIY